MSLRKFCNLIQMMEVLAHLSKCQHQNAVKLIWGPPGTGKTKTVSLSLFALFKLKCRTLTCAPTNIAVLEVAARLRRLVNHSLEYGKYGLGDIILFGNKKRMKVDGNADLLDVFLDHRAKTLYKCLVPLSGWKHLLESMICLLEDPDKQYSLYLEKHKENAQENEKDTNGNAKSVSEDDPLTFEEFMREEFDSVGDAMKFCMVVKDMVAALCLLKSFKSSLHSIGVPDEGSKLLLNDFKGPGSIGGWFTQLRKKYCLWILGNGSTLVNSDSIWKKLVLDAERRECFHNADEDNNLALAIAAALLELGQLHSLLNIDSCLFKNARWKLTLSKAIEWPDLTSV
ncbi:uncharacterized protein Pyn_09227 [Prunus yedoensis var. nudiflora]|uniref:DNA2/NAM7 helicase helicase domain-containing protein n=1 Tax=Prunus yedoensis var. nudiflora TaxID=2094558 RepID=A0A314UUY4_PRUYE|nr:uncharacterized protein Pyn_09227 [Prunus yedoensis var. nudiflora]